MNNKTENQPKKSIYEEFDSDFDSLDTDDAMLITYDENTDLIERKLLASAVVDCIVVAIWGKTSDGENFISLIHKSSPSSVEELMQEHQIEVGDSHFSYLIVPGPESQDREISKTKTECRGLFGEETQIDKPDEDEDAVSFTVHQHEERYDKSSVVITGLPDDKVSIKTVCPSPDKIRKKMAINGIPTMITRNRN